MKFKSLKRKLFLSIMMVALTFATLGTSTYAWFSMNRTVTATGMQVEVEAPTSLLISKTSATEGFGATVALENDVQSAATKFVPVAYAGICANWFKITSEAMAKVNEQGRIVGVTELADGTAATSFTSATFDHDNNASTAAVAVYAAADENVYHDTIWLKLEGDQTGTKDVTVSAAYTAQPTDAIKNAMHIVFVVDGTVAGTIDMGTTSTPVITTLTANDAAKQVDIYYFLSGNDTDCKNVNITADASMSVDLTFSIPEN